MTTKQMTDLVDRYLDSRGLKNPRIRKTAARNVLRFMDATGSFVSRGQLALPSDKKIVKAAYEHYKCKPINGAEDSVINHVYELAGSAIGKSISRPTVAPKATKSVASAAAPVKGLAAAEKRLIQGDFVSVGALFGEMVPDVPGLYCIKLRKGAKLPAKYGKVREDGIIYIGQASTSLRQRFWKQELNHIGAATFFRSIGAMLGYLPPKGSLAGKRTTNYKFSPEDTEAIRKWMQHSLLVNCIVVEALALDDIEETMIRKYTPLVNIAKNPAASEALKAAREDCVAYAKSE